MRVLGAGGGGECLVGKLAFHPERAERIDEGADLARRRAVARGNAEEIAVGPEHVVMADLVDRRGALDLCLPGILAFHDGLRRGFGKAAEIELRRRPPSPRLARLRPRPGWCRRCCRKQQVSWETPCLFPFRSVRGRSQPGKMCRSAEGSGTFRVSSGLPLCPASECSAPPDCRRPRDRTCRHPCVATAPPRRRLADVLGCKRRNAFAIPGKHGRRWC